MEEEWRPVKGYEGLYEVSNMGRVKSLYYGKERIMRTPDNSTGYRNVELARQTPKRKLVHRLVAEAFIPNPMNLPVVNHLDGDKHNDCVFNLEWCTKKENTNHAIKTGLMKITTNPKPIMAYRSGKFVGTFKSMAECANELNCKIGNISDVIHGKRKTHHGFSFRLVNDDDLSRGDFRDYAIKMVAIQDTQVIKARSGHELANKLGVSQGAVSNALKYGTKIKGFIVRKDE